MLFDLPQIDEAKTKDAARSVLKQFKQAYDKIMLYQLPKMTATYSIVPPSYTNQFHSSTEDAVILMDESRRVVDEFIQRFNRMDEETKMILFECYLKDISQSQIASASNYSESNVSVLKSKALLKFATYFNCEVLRK